MTVSYDEYFKELTAFCKKHNAKAECKVETGPMTDNRYYKNYMYSDGHNWSEVTELVIETVKVEVHGIVVTTEVSFWKTEYYSSENGASKYFYEWVK